MNASQHIQSQAYMLRLAFENEDSDQGIRLQIQELARSLGGIADVREMTPPATALYLLSLLLSQPEGT